MYYYYIDDKLFKTKVEAFEYFLDTFDLTDNFYLNEVCEKMGYTKEELLGTLLSLSLRNETLDNLSERVLDAIEEIFQENLEEEEEEDGD